MTTTKPTIRVNVDPTNPGQFFACCGLLELGHRLWVGAEGWFDDGSFALSGTGTLRTLLAAIRLARPSPRVPGTPTTAPLLLPKPFDFCMDWWLDERAGGSTFKTWAGQQKVVSIASAMHAVIDPESLDGESLLNTSAVLYDAAGDKVEPFYLDSRRAAQSHSLDVGFSPDAQKMLMPVFSAVEFLCLVGIQRFRPVPCQDNNAFGYSAWRDPLPISVAAAAASGSMASPGLLYRFQMLYRTKYLKGFLPATRVGTLHGGNDRERHQEI